MIYPSVESLSPPPILPRPQRGLRLRGKVLTAGAAVMGILFALVTLTWASDWTEEQYVLRRDTAAAAAAALALTLENLPATERVRTMRNIGQALVTPNPRGQTLFEAWALRDESERIAAWSRPEAPPDEPPAQVQAYEIHQPLPGAAASWVLLVQPAPSDFEWRGKLLRLFAALLLGAAFLLLVLHASLLRLVVRPVERLAATATAGRRAAASPRKEPLPSVPPSKRADEIGELIIAYNEMVAELNDLRTHLEQRVEETRKKLAEAHQRLAVEERLAAVGRLASGVAHEINNPLGGMLNAARALHAKENDPRLKAYLDLILAGLERIRDIVGAMRSFVRTPHVPDAAHETRAAQTETVDLAAVLAGALLFCRHRLDELSVALRENYPPAPSPFRVNGRGAELGQACLNLLLNALDALTAKTGDAQRVLELSLACESAADAAGETKHAVVLRIADNGQGMTDAQAAKAGEWFFTTKAGGSGLGLAVTQQIIKDHDGTLSFESVPGQGTVAKVVLPASDAPEATNKHG